MEHAITLDSTTIAALGVGLGFHAFSLISFVIMSGNAKPDTIIYYRVNTVTYAIATICYTLMIVDGSNYITSDGRLVLWARYLEFILGTPLLIIDLCLVAGSSFGDIFYLVSCDMLMIACGWFASISPTAAGRWSMYSLGCLAFAPIIITILTTMRESAKLLGKQIEKMYTMLSVYMLIVWFAYPIVWILHDGTHKISLGTESILHTIIDVLAKDIFGFVLVYSHGFLHRALSEATIQHSSSSLFGSHDNSFAKRPSHKHTESVHSLKDADLGIKPVLKTSEKEPTPREFVQEIVKQNSREIKTKITGHHVIVSVPSNSSNPYQLEIELPMCGVGKVMTARHRRDIVRSITPDKKKITNIQVFDNTSDDDADTRQFDLNVPSTPTRA